MVVNFYRFLLLILACYRLANLVAEDDGPGDVLKKLRQWTDKKRKEEQQISAWHMNMTTGSETSDLYFLEKRGKWANIDDGIRCPYCVGVWTAALLAILVYTGIGEFLVFVLAIAGGQSVLQNMRKE